MRLLNFIVYGQTIKKDQACDFSGLVKGSKGYLTASFAFDGEWTGCGKLAVFTCLGKEYPEKLKGNTCNIPDGALKHNRLSVRVVGIRPGFRIQTNDIEIKQEG